MPRICICVEDGQTIFQALAELPFKYVYELIGKMNHTTNRADPEVRDGRRFYTYSLTAGERALILEALGRMPYHQVHDVIQALEAASVRS